MSLYRRRFSRAYRVSYIFYARTSRSPSSREFSPQRKNNSCKKRYQNVNKILQRRPQAIACEARDDDGVSVRLRHAPFRLFERRIEICSIFSLVQEPTLNSLCPRIKNLKKSYAQSCLQCRGATIARPVSFLLHKNIQQKKIRSKKSFDKG